jgi:hypothetical protein
MFRRFYLTAMAAVCVALAAAYVWPRSRYVTSCLVVLYAVAFGIWAAIWPGATKQAFYEGQATEWSRRSVERTPLLAVRLLGAGFLAFGLFFLYVFSFCPSYRAACMGPFAALGFGN